MGGEAALRRRFEAVIFDWDGTAVPDRAADASAVRILIERLCALGMDVAVVSGTNVDNVDGQLGARPGGPGKLHLMLNRGSEVFAVGEHGVGLVERRRASRQEEGALDAAARLTVERLAQRGIGAAVVSERLNRRKIDLIPLPEWSDPPKARIAELLVAVERRLGAGGLGGLASAVELAREAAAEAGLPAARVTSDAKHVEVGLTDKSDSARWILRDLWRRGVGPGLVLVVGDELGSLGGAGGSDAELLVPEAERATAVSVGVEPDGVPAGVHWLGGGPGAFRHLLVDQLARRVACEVPALDGDPGWTLSFDGDDPDVEAGHDSLLTLADGRLGTVGSALAAGARTSPRVVAAGIYRGDGAETEPLAGPLWHLLDGSGSGAPPRRELDLRAGVVREEQGAGAVRAVFLSSLARPGTTALRANGPDDSILTGRPLAAPEGIGGAHVEEGVDREQAWMRTQSGPAGLTAAAVETTSRRGGIASLDRLAAYGTSGSAPLARKEAVGALESAREAGFERLLVEHRVAWGRRWDEAEVEIEGDAELQRAVRLALFHLMASVHDEGEAAVGPRGLGGRQYRGHVFWDADVFVLPLFASTHPAAARAMLEYRARRLPAAISAARAQGRSGARFPWESAATGEDVTPGSVRDVSGRLVGVQTGRMEEHIVADVAWAVSHYLDWTGDEAFATGMGLRIIVETARYWASRIEADSDGRGHIRGVIGPDEYHVDVDDNAFTNVMARWNLRRAAALACEHGDEVSDEELGGWIEAAEGLVDGYDPKTGLYEQFAGFDRLEPLVIADLGGERRAAADGLGAERLASAQVVKQADVLMLHHLVPDEVMTGSLAPNLTFYEPRTAHTSSLSIGVHAALLARVGRLEEAVDALRLTARIDLDERAETAGGGGGVHLGAMGTIWQAIAFGFLGVRATGGVLRLDPRLPGGWDALGVRLRFRGARVRLRVERDELLVSTDRAIPLAIGEGTEPATIAAGTSRFPRR